MRLAWCSKEFGSEARPATFSQYFCHVKQRMRITLLEWNKAVENNGGWCMRPLVPLHEWKTVSYEKLVAFPLYPPPPVPHVFTPTDASTFSAVLSRKFFIWWNSETGRENVPGGPSEEARNGKSVGNNSFCLPLFLIKLMQCFGVSTFVNEVYYFNFEYSSRWNL